MSNEAQPLYVLMEAGDEIQTVAGLWAAAKWWQESPHRREIWRLGPSFDGLMPRSKVPEDHLVDLLREVAPYEEDAV